MVDPRNALGSDPFARRMGRPTRNGEASPPRHEAPEPEAAPLEPVRKPRRHKAARAPHPPVELEPAIEEVQGELAEGARAPLDPIAVDPLPAAAASPSTETSGAPGLRNWWSRWRMRGVADEVDGFGFDPLFHEEVLPLLDFLFRRYWRVTMSGVENIPADGRVMLVGNHSGGVPYDALMLMYGVAAHHGAHRLPRPLIEDSFWHLPFLGVLLSRLGCVRANPENAERLLRQEQVLAVFPEGLKGLGKPFRDRYKLQRFGRGGFIKLALKTGAPILPVSIVGAEEIHPMLGKVTWPLTLSGIPYVAITPTFPWLGALGMLPLPTRWSIRIGPPVDLKLKGDVDLNDQVLINQLSERVRSEIQRMVDDGLAARRSVFFG